jgi:hypothetical protein
MSVVHGTLLNPLSEFCNLHIGEAVMIIWRWHDRVIVIGGHAADQFAQIRLAWDNRWFARFTSTHSGLKQVEPQFALSGSLVGAVAMSTPLGQNRSDVAAEIDFVGTQDSRNDQTEATDQQDENAPAAIKERAVHENNPDSNQL